MAPSAHPERGGGPAQPRRSHEHRVAAKAARRGRPCYTACHRQSASRQFEDLGKALPKARLETAETIRNSLARRAPPPPAGEQDPTGRTGDPKKAAAWF